MADIEYTVGSESHSSAWGKFYVKGLEQWEVKEDGQRDRHHSYATLICLGVPDRKVFTVFSQSGSKRGTDAFDFYVCESRDDTLSNQITGGCYGSGGKISGNFLILAHGEGKVKAPRLMKWWGEIMDKCAEHKNAEGKLLAGTKKAYAFWCAEHLKVRGLGEIPPLPASAQEAENKD